MIRGHKVILRPFRDGFSDEELWLQYKWSRDKDIVRWSNMAPSTLSFADFVQQFQCHIMSNPAERELFAILLAEGGTLIGRIGYFNVNARNQEAELGIIIGEKEYWGQGYGPDAMATLVEYIFPNTSLERVYLFTLQANIRAHACFAKSGFREIARNRRFAFDGGEYEDVQMEMTRHDWLVHNNARIADYQR